MSEWGLLGLFAGLTILTSLFMIFPFRRRLISGLICAPVVLLAAFTGYFYWGSFGEWRQYVHYLDSQEHAKKMLQTIKSPHELIEKLRKKLDDTPKSAQGWYLLGRLYSSQNEKQAAVDAFAKAYQFNPNNEQYIVNYAQSLWVMNNQRFTEQITELLNRLLKNNPDQPDALAMLAMNAFVKHAYEDSINYWQHLLKIVPAQSEEAKTIRKAIVKAEALIKDTR